MTDAPWQGDASSLVEAFRKGERSPREELEATLAAIDASDLNAFSHVDPERALAAADHADVNLPFGGVPAGVKELDAVAGWPDTDASLVFKDRIATTTSPNVERLRDVGGAVLVGLTTASEFGGLNVSVTKLNGVTHNPWRHGRTVGGSSAGSSSAVAGGLVTIATGSDGGGSIRIPAGYTGLFGMKGTFGRIPRGPSAFSRPNTAVQGCLSRSVRDAARFFDVCAGPHPIDPLSITSPGGWEAGLGNHDLAGLKVAVVPGLGGVTLEDGVEQRIREHAAALIEATGMKEVDLDFAVPNITAEWMMGNTSTLLAELGDLWPACAGDLTQSVEDGLRISAAFYNLRTAGVAEHKRLLLNRAMADVFDQVDLVIGATNPGPAFPATAEMSKPLPPLADKAMSSRPARLGMRGALGAIRVAGSAAPNLPAAVLAKVTAKVPEMLEMGGLTIMSNIYGNPAVSIPAGLVDGLPVGMQVLARHHADDLLFDVGLAAERELPWPITAAAGRS
jgi:aspartyl-tRNA(Asn)/glutamyl-tRNA(Gln) amidotransferase subunit A